MVTCPRESRGHVAFTPPIARSANMTRQPILRFVLVVIATGTVLFSAPMRAMSSAAKLPIHCPSSSVKLRGCARLRTPTTRLRSVTGARRTAVRRLPGTPVAATTLVSSTSSSPPTTAVRLAHPSSVVPESASSAQGPTPTTLSSAPPATPASPPLPTTTVRCLCGAEPGPL